ncbi:34300_t:CDS:2, partial [Gigaspora margarita]
KQKYRKKGTGKRISKQVRRILEEYFLASNTNKSDCYTAQDMYESLQQRVLKRQPSNEYTQKSKKHDKGVQQELHEASKSTNDSVIFDVPKDDQNSRNSLPPLESKMMSSLQLEINKQLNEEAPSQTFTTTLNKFRKDKEVDVNNE